MQPKFRDCAFDSTKDPTYFRTWLRLISGIVRTIQGGAQLEKFLDNYLLREKHVSATRPAFLDDPRLDFGGSTPSNRQDESSDEEAHGETSSVHHEASSEISAAGPQSYSDLDEDSVRLDKHLFHVLFTIVKGSMLSLIADLTGDYARYTFAVITM